MMNIVTRAGGIKPSAVVLVATVKTLETHGGGDMEVGAENLQRHLGIVKSFGYEPIVAVNRHPEDTRAELERARQLAVSVGAQSALVVDGYEHGGAGATLLAEAVLEAVEQPTTLKPTYALGDPLETKLEKIARLYGAARIELTPAARKQLERLEAEGLGELPVCMAKTHLSLSHDLALGPTPVDFTLPIRELRAYTGAGWIVALCGEMMTMPGLGRKPAAHAIDIDDRGRTVGLF
jgi:formate--tetrahydrofolate ligase